MGEQFEVADKFSLQTSYSQDGCKPQTHSPACCSRSSFEQQPDFFCTDFPSGNRVQTTKNVKRKKIITDEVVH